MLMFMLVSVTSISFSLYKCHLSNFIITYVLVELHNCLMMEEHEICLIFVQICKGRTNRNYVSSSRNICILYTSDADDE